jgi:serine/threonine protein kinase
MIGQTLGHYRIVEKIGAGGMGVVYRAHDGHLERDVALKVLPTGAVANESACKQLRKEALALSKLSHPNIATVFDFDTQEGVDFLAMELVPGYERNLSNVLDLQSEVAQAIAQQVRVAITPQEQAHLAKKRPMDPEVYELYLRGRHIMMRGGKQYSRRSSTLETFCEWRRCQASPCPTA